MDATNIIWNHWERNSNLYDFWFCNRRNSRDDHMFLSYNHHTIYLSDGIVLGNAKYFADDRTAGMLLLHCPDKFQVFWSERRVPREYNQFCLEYLCSLQYPD